MVRRRLNARDVRYVADYEAAQKLITRIHRLTGPMALNTRLAT